MQQYEKILVVCPSNMTTGGPEALHQLVSHMRDMNLPAYIVYTPFENSAQTPSVYQKYNVEITKFEDKKNYFIIFPEIYPNLATKVKYARASLWWLSLDNFLLRKNTSRIRDTYHYLRAVILGKRPIFGAKSLRQIVHFSQTHHSSQYLEKCGIQPIPLIDSINEYFLNDNYKLHLNDKKNIILYNPTKGKKISARLIKTFPQYQFIPLKGYKPEELAKLFYSAKLYMEFGQHPGRDRMPREAAMHGCCVITHTLGSAGNDIDVPIPKKYKINSSSPTFIDSFHQLAKEVFQDFEKCSNEFESYRQYLKNEPTIFKQQIKDFFK